MFENQIIDKKKASVLEKSKITLALIKRKLECN